MKKFFRPVLFAAGIFLMFAAIAWFAGMAVLPYFFLKFLQKKYAIVLTGDKHPVWGKPQVVVRNASFIWNDKVQLVQGDFDVALDFGAWIGRRVWAMDLRADGAHLRFLGDWLKKTGVQDVATTRLRVALDFSDDGIQDIRNVELASPEYQFQIQSRMKPAA